MSEKGLENNSILTAEKAEQNASSAPRKGQDYNKITEDIEKRTLSEYACKTADSKGRDIYDEISRCGKRIHSWTVFN